LLLFPISLGVSHLPDTEGLVSKPAAKLDKKKAEKTLHRDDFTCRFCGFRSEHYQRIIPWEEAGDPPFATACGFCEQSFMLDRTGLAGAAVLIWFPEVTQPELNHIARAIYVARASKNTLSASATRALDALMARRSDAKKRIGSDDPLLLATVIYESLSKEEYGTIGEKLDGIRLLPLEKHLVRTPRGEMNQFQQMVKFWCSPEGPYARLPAEQWADLFKAATPAPAAGNA